MFLIQCKNSSLNDDYHKFYIDVTCYIFYIRYWLHINCPKKKLNKPGPILMCTTNVQVCTMVHKTIF